jgi:hypothetical protein
MAALATGPAGRRARIRLCRFARRLSRIVHRSIEEVSGQMRFIGLDVHRDFCDVAIYEHFSLGDKNRFGRRPEGPVPLD